MGRSRKKNAGLPKPPVLNEDGTVKVYPPPPKLYVESLDLEAQGIARISSDDGDDADNGKVVFIEGALPYETVSAQIHRKKNNWEMGTLTQIHKESAQRVTPGCPHFGLHQGACGGCKMQHLEASAQVAVKARALEDQLWHLAKVKPEVVMSPISGPTWGYRYRARLSVRYVLKKGEVLIGFHERKSRYVADIKSCAILVPHVSAMLMPLRALIASMEARETTPQIELACGDSVTALVLRHLEPLSDGDIAKLREFAAAHKVQWWLQSKGPETVKLLDEGGEVLSYALPDYSITMPFKPTDFTQVNPQINRVLVTRALRLLDVQKHERVIDWFCGLGNFTLPLATQAREVLGIEGSDALVQRANDNLKQNFQLNSAVVQVFTAQAATSFVARNLFDMTGQMLIADGAADKWLVDPPREGAFALVKVLADLHQQRLGLDVDVEDGKTAPIPGDLSSWTPPKRIVYVSCNPATLARDAGLLVHKAGYRCTAAGMVNMFPHTAHVESMAVFELAE
jgi:23S rRNA (uracil1939-C5)-methyltransferase